VIDEMTSLALQIRDETMNTFADLARMHRERGY
jgi:hypothetical protein